MSDDTPNPSFRAMKTEKGVPTTECTITPLETDGPQPLILGGGHAAVVNSDRPWSAQDEINLLRRAQAAGLKLRHIKDRELTIFALDLAERVKALENRE